MLLAVTCFHRDISIPFEHFGKQEAPPQCEFFVPTIRPPAIQSLSCCTDLSSRPQTPKAALGLIAHDIRNPSHLPISIQNRNAHRKWRPPLHQEPIKGKMAEFIAAVGPPNLVGNQQLPFLSLFNEPLWAICHSHGT